MNHQVNNSFKPKTKVSYFPLWSDLHCWFKFIKQSFLERACHCTGNFLSAQLPLASLVSGKKQGCHLLQSNPGYAGCREDMLFRSVSKKRLLKRGVENLISVASGGIKGIQHVHVTDKLQHKEDNGLGQGHIVTRWRR